MNFRTFRFLASILALTASLSLLSSPLAADGDGGGLCKECIHNCPESEYEEQVRCFYICGLPASAVCGEHEDCNGNAPNLIVCEDGSPD